MRKKDISVIANIVEYSLGALKLVVTLIKTKYANLWLIGYRLIVDIFVYEVTFFVDLRF